MALAAGAVSAPAAGARGSTVIPPGNSGIGQYIESIPTVKGGRPTTSGPAGAGPGAAATGSRGRTAAAGAAGRAASSAAGLSPAAQRVLRRQGARGREVAALARVTGPRAPRSSETVGAGRAPAASVARAVTGLPLGGGSEPWLLAALVVIAVAPALLKLRSRRTGR